MLARTFVAGRTADVTADHGTLGVVVSSIQAADRNHLPGHLYSIYLQEHTRELTISLGSKNLPPFTENTEADFGIGQRVLFKQVVAVAKLGIATLQKLQACRYCAEEVAHGDDSPLRTGGSADH